MSGELRELFDSLYQRFLLRDVFGKVILGLSILLAVAIVPSDLDTVLKMANSLSIVACLVVIGFGWIAGFAVQSLGELLQLILHYPRDHILYRLFATYETQPWNKVLAEIRAMEDLNKLQDQLASVHFENDFEFYQYWIPTHASLNDDEIRQLERLAVIKEACGNTYVALSVTLLILVVHMIVTSGPKLSLLFALQGLAISIVVLARMHLVHVRRQQYTSAAFIGRNLWSSPPP